VRGSSGFASRRNLLSLCAVDFGIIVHGAIVMTEAILRWSLTEQ
jgi:Cu/Ag efflux pump CusA